MPEDQDAEDSCQRQIACFLQANKIKGKQEVHFQENSSVLAHPCGTYLKLIWG